MSDRWTPEMRAEASARAKARYEAWASEHPDRAAFVKETWTAIEDGSLVRPVCTFHDRPAHPEYDWDAMAIRCWRCRAGHWLWPQPTPVSPPPPAHEEVDTWL